MDDKSIIQTKATINHTANQTTVEERSGYTRKLYTGTADAYSIAQAFRAAAYNLLERADMMMHNEDFYHLTTPQTIEVQAKIMIRENTF